MGNAAEGNGIQALVDKIAELVREGNARRVVVTDKTGRKILDLPINAGVVAAFFFPTLTAAGAALALAGGWKIQVEHTTPEPTPADPTP
ncbi:DUF4342 domain-containing protein [Actinophytocola sp. NPDC049390]|uniref:DUF4342 domain-containing protein n=1 Tax=Actinophytocola sp. NPDC049390 TaxID=3363894 RepID=UPI0037BCA6C6